MSRIVKHLIMPGMFITKENAGDAGERDKAMEALTADMSDALGSMKKFKGDFDAQAIELKNLRDTVEKAKGEIDGETKLKLKESADALSEAMTKMQACEAAVETLQKNMDQPINLGKGDLADNDRKMAIELQRRAHMAKGYPVEEFKADLDNLVKADVYRDVVRKLEQVGIESKARILRDLSEPERKAFEAASLDSGFFAPEMLGFEVDCDIECSSLLDLYDNINVPRSTFKFPHVEKHGDIGQYTCDAGCEGEYGEPGNITWKNGSTADFRGQFCFQRETLKEANYPLLQFMFNSAARSYRIKRNAASITGDGINEPLGWLTADVFDTFNTPDQTPDHVDLRQFLASAPVELGAPTATMHQNTFAYFASQTDTTGRFIFGDGLMGFSPDDVRDRIRISNCLPDPTEGGTKNTFTAGDFIMAAGVWKEAYKTVVQTPMFMEQFEGRSSAWCVAYQFGAKDGGFVACKNAARVLKAGAAAV